jgi:LysR family transcriptional regulator, carnitine catabolism transcriptional activator
VIDSLRHVRAFLAIAHWGSFTRASLELHVSQPALTVQIQQLENSLGVTLFERNKRKVSLTQAGQDLLAPLERLVVDAEAIMGTSRDFNSLRRGIVTVAAVPSLAATLLPAALGEFCQSYPGIVVRLRDSVGNLLELVKSGEVDFGVGGESQRDRGVTVEELLVEPMCVFAPMTHPLAGRRRVTLAQVAEHPAILPQRYSSLRAILDRALEQHKIVLRPLHETSHISTTIGMVNAGLGIAILPRRALDCFFSSSIRCIEIHNPVIERTVVIATRTGRTPSPAVKRLIEILHQHAQEPVTSPRYAARRMRR